jgi:hypothetical protein
MDRINFADLIAENTKRLEYLLESYDPHQGTPGSVQRSPLFFYSTIHGRGEFNAPLPLFQERLVQEITSNAGNLDVVSYMNNCTVPDVLKELTELRCKHDFEFWAWFCVRIKPKITKIGDGKNSAFLIPFKLNRPQRKLLKTLETMRLAGLPIRVVLLKARQWGGSTLVQHYIFWLQLYHYPKSNSAIVTDVESQARNIRSMITNTAKYYPKEFDKITLRPHEGDTKIRVINTTQSIIAIGSIQKPDSLRSFDWSFAHLSEVGLWKETQGKKPEDLAQSIKSSVLSEPGTLIVEESTAKGVGNYFHRQWQAAEESTIGYQAVFVAWFEIEMYIKIVEEGYDRFVKTWTVKEWELWNKGATIEGIKWYLNFKKTENYDDWRMGSEFPSDPNEAFQSTGRRVFAPDYVRKARRSCKPFLFRGDVFGEKNQGPDALKKIQFKEYPMGILKIWKMPNDPYAIGIENRYVAFADIGGRSDGSDKSEIVVIDRYWMKFGMAPEVVASYTCNTDQDLFAWKAVQICAFYQNALLGMETNSLKKEKSDGDHFLTVLDTIKDHYDNLFIRSNPEQLNDGSRTLYGFHTNQKTKGMIIDTLNACLRDDGYIERDLEACDQMDTYEVKKDGTMGAIEGTKDDKVIVRAGALWLAISYCDSPIEKEISRYRKKVAKESDF